MYILFSHCVIKKFNKRRPFPNLRRSFRLLQPDLWDRDCWFFSAPHPLMILLKGNFLLSRFPFCFAKGLKVLARVKTEIHFFSFQLKMAFTLRQTKNKTSCVRLATNNVLSQVTVNFIVNFNM